MSWIVGLSIGTSFAELSAVNGGKRLHGRWYLPTKKLADGLEEFINQNPELSGSRVRITTRLARTVMQRKTGARVALLVTAGFENWPHIRQPLAESSIALSPHRQEPLLTSDLVFGVEERISANGKIVKAITEEDLAFLASKLEMTDTKQVAIGFLHSTLNAVNEKKAAEFLRQKGFEVLCSSETEEGMNEVARWWRAVLNAYVTPAFHEFEAELKPVTEKHSLKLEFISSDGTFFAMEPQKYFSSAFGHIAALREFSRRKKAKTVLHLGLEGFLVVRSDEDAHIWQSEYGPVAIPAPGFLTLPVQPTSIVEPKGFAGPHLSEEEAGFEPGPMLMGRAHRPTLIDCLHVLGALPEIPGLTTIIPAHAKNRILESLFTFSKSVSVSHEEMARFLTHNAAARISFELRRINVQGPILLTGALTQPLGKWVKNNLPSLEWIEGDWSWGSSLGAAEIGLLSTEVSE